VFHKLGCVVYGCCWGVQLSHEKWYATRYFNERSKVIRMRPDLAGKPLLPVSTIMAMLFAKNVLCCGFFLWSSPFVPGAFSSFLPWLNRIDKCIYFPYRGDSLAEGGTSGWNCVEEFRMVSACEKRAHCERWSWPSKLNGILSIVSVSFNIYTGNFARVRLSSDHVLNALHSEYFLETGASLFVILFLAYGYHYKTPGRWIPARKR